uniref:Uncharacterized protein n=1 Tax=Triticum urartu TaxID=4572 RepID=A0A8R7Q465_TRIUA
MTGHIVLVIGGWRYCGLMSLEQSDPSKIGRATASTSDGNTPVLSLPMPPPPFGPDSSARADTFPSLTSPLFFVKAKKKQEQKESEHHRKDDYKQATRTSQ